MKKQQLKSEPYMMNRELSWLKFNERVLNEAGNPAVPLAERLTFASIYQSNQDEFYRVRVGTLMAQMESKEVVRENKTNMTSEQQVKAILQENAEVTDVKRAAAFFKLIRYSYGSGCTSYGCQPFDVRKCFAAIWQASRRLSDTVVENKDFEALIRQYDRENAFFYCDPPYYETEGHYAVVFRKEDHTRLRDALAVSKGKWMVSYNDCEFIRELYAGYTITAVTRINNLAQRYDGGCEFPEVIITNYDPREQERTEPRQLHLFSLYDEDEDDRYAIAEPTGSESEAI